MTEWIQFSSWIETWVYTRLLCKSTWKMRRSYRFIGLLEAEGNGGLRRRAWATIIDLGLVVREGKLRD